MKTAILILGVAATATASQADVISTFTNRATFNAAAGVALTVEGFTDSHHFPISTGILNSETNLDGFMFGGAPILPGDIEAGATYSTPIGQGNFFNIDIGGQHVGGFLDSLGGLHPLTVDFTGVDPSVARSISAFGFDLGSIGGGTQFTTVTISFEMGPDQVFAVPYDFMTVNFFGFVSDTQDITSVSIINDATFLAFDLDNFTFNALECVALPYCVGAPNSVGTGASLQGTGSTSIIANDFVLNATGCPSNMFGLFFYGPDQVPLTPFGDGNRCVGGSLARLPVITTDAGGSASHSLDYGSLPANAQIVAGSIWNFQLWYRDPNGPGGSGSNASNGLEVHFCD
jgi:hypothetical protein